MYRQEAYMPFFAQVRGLQTLQYWYPVIILLDDEIILPLEYITKNI